MAANPASTNQSPSRCTLDHIVHLSAPGLLPQTVELFESFGFQIIPGGTHADGLTSNALVVFSDGVYLELIQFLYPAEHYKTGSEEHERRILHRWSSKTPGWIDWANKAFDSSISQEINSSASQNDESAMYDLPKEGGRRRPDGQELRWRVAFPTLPHGRGALPFFCEDLTDRSLRVPNMDPGSTNHSPALGIAHIHLVAHPVAFPRLSKQLSSVLGTPVDTTKTARPNSVFWNLNTPARLDLPVHLILSEGDQNMQTDHTIHDVGLWGSDEGDAHITQEALAPIRWVIPKTKYMQ